MIVNQRTVHDATTFGPRTTTRFPELDLEHVAPGLWRWVDVFEQERNPEQNCHVGPHYKTKAEAFGDLERYAAVFGCTGAAEIGGEG